MIKTLTFLTNPGIFNIIILTLYVLATIRWMVAGNLFQSIYWFGATVMMVGITFFMENK